LHLALILDQDHPVAGLGDLGKQRVDKRGLAGRGAAERRDVLARDDPGAPRKRPDRTKDLARY
jgi:hypothetical protein